MGTTKIWPIKYSLSDVLKYAANPDKTLYSDLQAVLHYAENSKKTVGDEEVYFVTGVNCNADTTFAEMISVQKRFGKTDGNVAYHAYQSFKTGEVTPELCHQIGVELARKMWGTEHQVIVATHMDTRTLHNHFVINSVNMWTGKKFNCNEGVYWRFRALSDELCAEHHLTVIKNPKGKTPRVIYFAEKNGEPTKFNLMRDAIDFGINHCKGPTDFKWVMKNQGYVVEMNPRRKYWTIRSESSDKCVRMYKLGDEYSNEAILNRIRRQELYGLSRARDYDKQLYQMRNFQPKSYKLKGCLKNIKRHTGLYATYIHYLYLMGKLPKWNQRKPFTPEMREAWRHLDRISRQVTLMYNKKLNYLEDVQGFITETEQSIKEVTELRSRVYNKLRRCDDPEQREKLLKHRDDCTAVLKQLRKEKRIAETIIEDNPKIKENIRIETRARNRAFGIEDKTKTKSKQRSYER